jgi:DNA-binding MarR family transcriptional regulator
LPVPLEFDPIAEARRQWTDRWGEDVAPSMAAVTSIMRAQQILMARLNALLLPLDLNFPRYEALMLLYLSRAGSLPLGKMGQRLQVHATSITNIVDGLEHAGLVERVRHEHDRRMTLAAITAAGRKRAAEATRALNDARFATEPLREPELETLFAVLRELRLEEGDFVQAGGDRPAG